jgi:hypothetical protein
VPLRAGVHQAVLQYHEYVVESLKQQGEGAAAGARGGAPKLSELNEKLQAQLLLVRELVVGSGAARPAQCKPAEQGGEQGSDVADSR